MTQVPVKCHPPFAKELRGLRLENRLFLDTAAASLCHSINKPGAKSHARLRVPPPQPYCYGTAFWLPSALTSHPYISTYAWLTPLATVDPVLSTPTKPSRKQPRKQNRSHGGGCHGEGTFA